MIRTLGGGRLAPRILCPELVGREAETAALHEIFSQVQRGAMRVMLIHGDAGVGKTALVTRFAGRARRAGAIVLTGAAHDGSPATFGPFIELLSSATSVLSVEAVGRILRHEAVELLRLLPEAAIQRAPRLDDQGARERIFECFITFLAEVATRRPLVVVLEDMHSADEASLQLLPLLARRLRTRPVLLLATYRTEALESAEPLRTVVAQLDRMRLAESFPVRPLTVDASAVVIRTSLGWDASAWSGFCDVVNARCLGNPFFIEEVLQALAERDVLVYVGDHWELREVGAELPLPLSARAAVRDRLSSLPGDVRRILEIAAVIGRRFEFSVLRRITGNTEQQIARALRAAIGAQLVVEGDDGSYSFRHALTRESVLAELLRHEQPSLHLAVGEALEALATPSSPDRSEELAYHFDQAHDPRALHYHEVAADVTAKRGAHGRAADHLRRAIAMAPAHSAAVVRLQLRLADLCIQMNDLAAGERAADAARAAAESLGDVTSIGRSLLLRARRYGHAGDHERAADLRHEAIAILEPLGDGETLAALYADLAWHALLHADADEGEELAGRAAAMARRVGARATLAWALQAVGSAQIRRGERAAPETIREGLRLALADELPDVAQRGYANLVMALSRVGTPADEWMPIVKEQREHARRFGMRTPLFISNEVWYAIRAGRWDEALALAAELSGTGTQFEPLARLGALIVRLAREGPALTLRELGELHQRFRASNDPFVRPHAARAVPALVLAGQDEVAFADAEAADISPTADPQAFAEAATGALIAARRIGDGTAVERWAQRVLTGAPTHPMRVIEACRSFARGELALDTGERDIALRLLADAARILRDEVDPLLETLVRLRRAQVLAASRSDEDQRAAVAELAAVLPFWRSVKAAWVLRQLREFAGERRLPFPRPSSEKERRPRADPGRLTTREREVVELVSRGLTNREIANQLSISERTAEGHLEQVRHKLGLRNRALIAAWAAERRT